jgi:hypothetical protein
MTADAGWQITEQVLALAKRARDSLANLGVSSVNADGVFHHPATQLAALKATREHIEKAISIMERKWGSGGTS